MSRITRKFYLHFKFYFYISIAETCDSKCLMTYRKKLRQFCTSLINRKPDGKRACELVEEVQLT